MTKPLTQLYFLSENNIIGGCAPSLIAREGFCYQWSPVDGVETLVPCNLTDMKARFICDQD